MVHSLIRLVSLRRSIGICVVILGVLYFLAPDTHHLSAQSSAGVSRAWPCWAGSAGDRSSFGSAASDPTCGSSARPATLHLQLAERTAVPMVVPRVPASLTSAVRGNTIVLTWTAPDGGDPPDSYVLEAGSASGKSNLATADTGSPLPSLTATAMPPGTYFMRVRSVTSSGTSAPSNEIIVNVSGAGACSGAPGAPTALVSTVSGNAVSLTWQGPGGDCVPTSYVLEAGSASGLANLVSFSTGSTATTYATAGVGAGTYYVRIRSANGTLTSAASNEVVVTIGGGCSGPPGAPTAFSAIVRDSTVSLSWSASTGSPSSYVIEAGSSRGASDLVVSDTGSAATELTATAPNGTYFTRLRARNACGLSAPSAENIIIFRGVQATPGWIYEGVLPTPISAGFPSNNFGDSSALQLRDGRWRVFGNIFGTTGSAISPDGLSLTAEPGYRIPHGACGFGRAFRLDAARIKWYCVGPGGIRSFISNDEGVTFTADSGILIPNAAVSAPELAMGGVVRTRDGRWRMYFSDWLTIGFNPVTPPMRIFSAISSDLVSWTVEPGVRIGAGATAGGTATRPSVVVNPDGSVTVAYFRLYLDAQRLLNGSEPVAEIWLATSSDGVNFTSDMPTGISPAGDPDIVPLPGGGYRLYYDWGNQYHGVVYSYRSR